MSVQAMAWVFDHPTDDPAEQVRRLLVANQGDTGTAEMVALGMPEPIEPAREARAVKALIPSALRRQVYERDGYRCVTCQTWLDLSVDHRVPESRGGATILDNLQTMCRPCNSRKGTR